MENPVSGSLSSSPEVIEIIKEVCYSDRKDWGIDYGIGEEKE